MRPREYSDHVITFIDILGFKNLVTKESPEKIWEILDLFQEMTGSSDYEKFVMGRRTIAFSDTIVRASATQTPSGDAVKYGILFHELLSLVHAQVNLILRHGVFLRGAVSIGKAFQEGTTIYGPGLIRAYENESELAIFPRIIIDSAVLKTYAVEGNPLKAAHHSIQQDSAHVERLIREDADGVWFVDYLKAIESEVNDLEEYPGSSRLTRRQSSRHRKGRVRLTGFLKSTTGWRDTTTRL